MKKVAGVDVNVKVKFGVQERSLVEANKSLQAAAKIVKSLGLSLLGEHPGCVKELQIDEAEHMKVRQFHDVESLVRYMTYLDKLVARANELTPVYVPSFTHTADRFLYKTANERAAVLLMRAGNDEAWSMTGEVTLPNRMAACTVRKRLIEKGLVAKVV